MLHFYHCGMLTKTHRPHRRNGSAALASPLSNEGSHTQTHAHTLTRTHLHAASFISSTLFIRGSVASPQGIYNEEYISS